MATTLTPRAPRRLAAAMGLLAAAALSFGHLASVAEPAAALNNGLALTPPMGWNSWNQVHCYDLTEDVVKEAADAIVATGLQKAGYEYVVVDDCWQGGRDQDGVLYSDADRFPSGVPALAQYVHDKGLKFGIYGAPGTETCAQRYDDYPIMGLGSFGHEELDAQTFADWGVDYLKYDWCAAQANAGLTSRPAAFAQMRDELAATGRQIVYAISEYGDTDPWTWAAPIANLWRTTTDIKAEWSSVAGIIAKQVGLSKYAQPGAWNDPDMLQFANGSLTLEQNKSHLAMWSMLAAPLFLGTDLSQLSAAEVAVLTNPALVAIDQDPLGAQAELVSDGAGRQVWARPLAGGDIAVALYNPTSQAATISTTLAQVGARPGVHTAVDVWQPGQAANVVSALSDTVPAYGTAVYRLSHGGDPTLPGLVGATGSAAIMPGQTGPLDVTVTNLRDGALTGAVLEVAGAYGVSVSAVSTPIPDIASGASVTVSLTVSAASTAAYGIVTLPAAIVTNGATEDAAITVTVTPEPPAGKVYLSDLEFTTAQGGWKDIVRRDQSVDQNPLTVNGEAWAKGIASNSPSTVAVWLGGNCTVLDGALGVDDEVAGWNTKYGEPSIDGAVLGDGEELWNSGGVIGYQESKAFSLDVSGVDELRLTTGIGGDTNAYDHADWLDLLLTCASAPDPAALRAWVVEVEKLTASDYTADSWARAVAALAAAKAVLANSEATQQELDAAAEALDAAIDQLISPGPVPLALSAVVSVKCMAGKAYLTVRASNGSDVAAAVMVETPYGVKLFASVAPGASGLHMFTTKSVSYPAGEVVVAGSAGSGPSARSGQATVAHPGAECA
ncbi:MAG: NPCBM/NEW2 domain-containing protein [Bifidobacteriaceae bacterium]|jgi:alpha-galactosidase|nr:NPCBM/NEW2 domain-containing protein [Bifidobacteriaceae bacterium]